jgi:hypothetical protein
MPPSPFRLVSRNPVSGDIPLRYSPFHPPIRPVGPYHPVRHAKKKPPSLSRGRPPARLPIVLPKVATPDLDWPHRPPSSRPPANFDQELRSWLRAFEPPPPPRVPVDLEPVTWGEEPASGRLPFLIL